MLKTFVIGVLLLGLLLAGYIAIVTNWSYSTGERAGWVQKFSNKGWLCKTWEGELALVSLPGSTVEKFDFTVRDDAVAAQINKVMGQRVSHRIGTGEGDHLTGRHAIEERPAWLRQRCNFDRRIEQYVGVDKAGLAAGEIVEHRIDETCQG